MTPEQEAVIKAAKDFTTAIRGYEIKPGDSVYPLVEALDNLRASERPAFPDPPTTHSAWQSINGQVYPSTSGTQYSKDAPDTHMWRQLRVTYTPVAE